MYLLVGATGLLGGRIAARLAGRGLPVRAVVRPATDASALRALGIEVVPGDMRDVASLDAALHGVDTVITTANAMARALAGDRSVSIHDVDEVGNANLVDAAARAGVRRFVFVSMDRSELAAGTSFTDAKLATEERLRGAPFRTVVIRPEAFQEVWLSPLIGFDPVHGSVRVFGAGRARMPYVSVDDVAEAIVRLAAMEEPPAEVRLAGPEALSTEELVQRWTAFGGPEPKVSHVPRPMLAIGSFVLRPFKPALASTMGMALHADRVQTDATDADFRALGIEPRPVSAFLNELAEASPPA